MYHTHLLGTSKRWPVGKIVCLGRNYSEHIKELGNAVPDKPVIFIKPSTSIIPDGDTVIIPDYSDDCHHEVELALLIGIVGDDDRAAIGDDAGRWLDKDHRFVRDGVAKFFDVLAVVAAEADDFADWPTFGCSEKVCMVHGPFPL